MIVCFGCENSLPLCEHGFHHEDKLKLHCIQWERHCQKFNKEYEPEWKRECDC